MGLEQGHLGGGGKSVIGLIVETSRETDLGWKKSSRFGLLLFSHTYFIIGGIRSLTVPLSCLCRRAVSTWSRKWPPLTPPTSAWPAVFRIFNCLFLRYMLQTRAALRWRLLCCKGFVASRSQNHCSECLSSLLNTALAFVTLEFCCVAVRHCASRGLPGLWRGPQSRHLHGLEHGVVIASLAQCDMSLPINEL